MRYVDQQLLAPDFHPQYHPSATESIVDNDVVLVNSAINRQKIGETIFPDRQTRAHFATTLQHLVASENQSLRWQHQRLQHLNLRHSGISDRTWLASLAQRYGIECGTNCASSTVYNQLVQRVDEIPFNALLLAAATSSRFGIDTSAQAHRNLFALWQPKPPPRYRAEGFYPWRSFTTWRNSVRAFMEHINTDAAFAAYRQARAQQMPATKQLSALREALLQITPKKRQDWQRLEDMLLPIQTASENLSQEG